MNWFAIRYATRRALQSPRGSYHRAFCVGWRLACQLADRRWRR